MDSVELSVALLLLLLGAWLGIYVRRSIKIFFMRRRFKRGAQAETEAREVLEAKGYKLLDEQKTIKPTVLVDGAPREYSVRIDVVATRRGKTYGVEVKTGEKAINPTESSTRRQLLEYAHVYAFDGLFLLDMETRNLMKIEFPGHVPRQSRWARPWFVAVGFVLGMAAATLI
jgi:Holliday junction resolvase-like predicted endonuclease